MRFQKLEVAIVARLADDEPLVRQRVSMMVAYGSRGEWLGLAYRQDDYTVWHLASSRQLADVAAHSDQQAQQTIEQLHARADYRNRRVVVRGEV